MPDYPFFKIETHPEQKTAILYLNRPDKRNSLNWPFWRDLPLVIAELEEDPEIRCVIVAGEGKSFSMGLDLVEFQEQFEDILQGDVGDKRREMYKALLHFQSGMNAIANGENVYIAAVHKHCVGAGLDLAAACDMRLASKDAVFSLREARVATVADMGSLQRLPRIIGEGNTRLLALTGRDINADDAYRMGLVNEIYDTRPELMQAALALALEIAENSSMAVRGTKQMLNYSLDHSQEESLREVCLWNAAFIDTLDLREMLDAFANKRRPKFL